MLEFYQAYATYEDLMDLTEEMISEAAERGHRRRQGRATRATSLDFGRAGRASPWPRPSARRVPGALTDKDLADAGPAPRASCSKTARRASAERRAVAR